MLSAGGKAEGPWLLAGMSAFQQRQQATRNTKLPANIVCHPGLPASPPPPTLLPAAARSFEKYGGLSASLRTILDAPPKVDMDEYRQRSRVQVRRYGGAVPWGNMVL